MTLQTLNLFPTPVWLKQLEPEAAARVNRDALALIETFRPTAKATQAGGWATPTDLQDRPELQELMGLVREAAGEALAALGVEHDGFLVTGCWANVKPRGAGHPPHIHPNNFLSGVYYVRAPKAGGSIIFHDPRQQPFLLAPRTRERNLYNSRNANLPAREGTLLLFPAWLHHSVSGNRGTGERVSISFNIMFERFGEELARPKWGAQSED
ncbi:MAG: 2OG-Fe(II) oxygenase family protein [Kiloniellales bacterium]|nr:2OG-Fe(II) oxygenase family protein [Kiloniellales bacterium]